ncbi:MAG TPA: primosomal protein N' [Pirellulales bacterium]|jgi:primosomal protein N' (replication factor Y)|nr:primosomal protein N' [Pirellulales bacterium]
MSHQQPLFELEPAPWELDAAGEQLVATVVFLGGVEKTFDYSVPDTLRDRVEVGRRVRAPFGRANRLVTGYCVKLETRRDIQRRLKPLSEVTDERTLLSATMIRLTQWMAEHYLCSWAEALEAVLPAGVRSQAGTRRITLLSLAPDAKEKLPEAKLSKKQLEIVRYVAASPHPLEPRQLALALKCTPGPITALRRKGILKATTARISAESQHEPPVARQAHLQLNPDQQAALAAILHPLRQPQHETILIHGVTGSGKTEVYIQAIQEVISYGRQAIVLVPEISLTPQTRERFRARFDRVAVLHSHLRDAQRHWHWERIAQGEVQVVVGARSAVFAPVPHLGLIILDEEHEGSFKQDTAPRYHAREVALWRAREENVPLVLASATPSLESWYRAEQEEYHLVEMPRRVVGRSLPAVGTIDLRNEFHSRHSRGAVSRQMHQAIEAALREGGQVMLLLNRRGFATHIQCPACGHVVRCPHCDLPMTHHRSEDMALCHYCDYHEGVPSECPECHAHGIHFRGLGTQKLEAEIRARFRGVEVLRMDTDAMKAPGSHDRALAAFREGKVQILLGTQMIAKGLDFPNVTLVGVINADTALHLPDFRAAERTFQLVTQVAGRTGRGEKGGRVLVQTFSPDHPAIRAAVKHDFRAFAGQELPLRVAHGYPPITTMIRLVIRGASHEQTKAFAQYMGERLRETILRLGPDSEIRVLGPAAAPFAKLRGQHRFHLQLQSADGDQLRTIIRQATAGLEVPENILWTADVDPLDML